METKALWRDQYAAAMLELDHSQLGNRIQEAQAAVQAAIDQQIALRGAAVAEELQALRDAMHNLRTLRRMELSAASAPSPTTTFSMQQEEAKS
jgi:hypothetical protein